jgi:hypothetical protein
MKKAAKAAFPTGVHVALATATALATIDHM